MTRPIALGVLALSLSVATAAAAEDLYKGGGWASMASDRRATKVGDSVTVLIYENSVASSSAQATSHKTSQLGGQLTRPRGDSKSAQVALNGGFDATGQVDRVGKLVAQISVVVDGVLPNGDLHVQGEQHLAVNGERSRIRVTGRVRPADIGGDNTILSTRLSDAQIEYDGQGFVSRNARPGLLTRLSNWLGVP